MSVRSVLTTRPSPAWVAVASVLVAALVFVCLSSALASMAAHTTHDCGAATPGEPWLCRVMPSLAALTAVVSIGPLLDRPAATRLLVTGDSTIQFIASPASPVTPRSPPVSASLSR